MAKEKKGATDRKEVTEALIERGREVWLAGLGALDLVEEEGSRFFQRLVERGRAFEKEGKHRLAEVIEEVEERQKAVAEEVQEGLSRLERSLARIEENVTEAVEKTLHRLDVPTRDEVRALSNKVNALAEKVEKLAALLEAKETSAS